MYDGLHLRLRRHFHRQRFLRKQTYKPAPGAHPVLVKTLGIGVLLAVLLISALELRIRPIVEQMAAHQINNEMTRVINTALIRYLEQAEDLYDNLTETQRDEGGMITSVTSNMAQINRLRGTLVERILQTISEIDTRTLGIPIGNLFELDLLWAKGPRIGVRSLISGTVSAEINSYFESAGINQTLHRIILDVHVPLTVLLPGCSTVTAVETSVCVAETVIVGTVPGTYLQIGNVRSDRN